MAWQEVPFAPMRQRGASCAGADDVVLADAFARSLKNMKRGPCTVCPGKAGVTLGSPFRASAILCVLFINYGSPDGFVEMLRKKPDMS